MTTALPSIKSHWGLDSEIPSQNQKPKRIVTTQPTPIVILSKAKDLLLPLLLLFCCHPRRGSASLTTPPRP